MISQFLKINLVLLLLCTACKKDGLAQTNTLSLEEVKQRLNDTVIKHLSNKDYALKVVTYLSNDTLDVVDYRRDKYSSPIILAQKLSFFRQGKVLKHYELPIKKVKIKTITNTVLSIMRTPIYKICISKGYKEDFYIVQATEYDYCNGSDCLEFIGIYSMSGSIVYEGYHNEKGKTSLKDVLTKNQIELKNLNNCIETDKFE